MQKKERKKIKENREEMGQDRERVVTSGSFKVIGVRDIQGFKKNVKVFQGLKKKIIIYNHIIFI